MFPGEQLSIIYDLEIYIGLEWPVCGRLIFGLITSSTAFFGQHAALAADGFFLSQAAFFAFGDKPAFFSYLTQYPAS
jgi:hypothetical protein